MDTTLQLIGDRVRKNTPRKINEKIDHVTNHNIARYSEEDESAIRQRIRVLDNEWDTDRSLQLVSGINILAGIVLGLAVNRRWLILSAVSAGFLVQQALQGWCPPLPLLRRYGVRTRNEINKEKHALLDKLQEDNH